LSIETAETRIHHPESNIYTKHKGSQIRSIHEARESLVVTSKHIAFLGPGGIHGGVKSLDLALWSFRRIEWAALLRFPRLLALL